jgi:hypothetical protein
MASKGGIIAEQNRNCFCQKTVGNVNAALNTLIMVRCQPQKNYFREHLTIWKNKLACLSLRRFGKAAAYPSGGSHPCPRTFETYKNICGGKTL